jgi:hypothetical protein
LTHKPAKGSGNKPARNAAPSGRIGSMHKPTDTKAFSKPGASVKGPIGKVSGPAKGAYRHPGRDTPAAGMRATNMTPPAARGIGRKGK